MLGIQHYTTHYLFGDHKLQQQRDIEKRQICQQAGITLIDIPYWWDHKLASLMATIHKIRPDIFPLPPPPTVTPIPISPPKQEKSVSKTVVDWIMVPEPWMWNSTERDHSNWWIAEKVQGVPVYWNGSHLLMWNGDKVDIPASLRQELPSYVLECILSYEPSLKYHSLLSVTHPSYKDAMDMILAKDPEHPRWKQAVLWVVDMPTENNLKLEERMEFMKNCISSSCFVRPVQYQKGLEQEMLHKARERGSEIIMRKPESYHSRSGCLHERYYVDLESYYVMKGTQVKYALVADRSTLKL